MPDQTTVPNQTTAPDSFGFARAVTLREARATRFDVAFTATTGACPWPKAYGGDLVAQASVAAMRTVTDGKALHSMHSYFLRPADVEGDVHWEVEVLRDGRGFSARQVRAFQHDKTIFAGLASFGFPGRAYSVAAPFPSDIPDAEALPSATEYLAGRTDGAPTAEAREYWMAGRSFDMRHVPGPIYLEVEGERTLHQAVWVRPFSPLTPVAGLTDAQRDLAALAYVCDYTILEPILRALGLAWSTPDLVTASLDHAMWFHRAPSSPTALNDWVLYAQSALAADDGRGTAVGRLFERDGRHLASVVQEGLIRRQAPTTAPPH